MLMFNRQVRVVLAVTLLCSVLFGFTTPTFAISGGGHILGGAAVSTLADSAGGAFVLGLASHAILDTLPHYDYNLTTQILLLVGASALVKWQYDQTGDIRIVVGAVGGFLPDIEHVFRKLGIQNDRYFPTHNGSIPHGKAPNMWQGIWLEVGAIGILWGLAF
jgi:hypothetical protein